MNAPKLITRQTMAAEAVKRYVSQSRHVPRLQRTIEALQALPPSATADEVDAVIGNGSWTKVPVCDCCEQDGPVVVQLGEEPDYDSATVYACPACLRVALALIP